MSHFEYAEPGDRGGEPPEDGRNRNRIRIHDYGPKEYTNCQMSIPKDVVDDIGIEPGTFAVVESTDNGFEVTVEDI